MSRSRKIVLRYLLAKVLAPHRSRVALDMSVDLPTLWYENENGEKWVPDVTAEPFTEPPPGFVYQHSRFPRSLVENVLRLVTRKDVDSCAHSEVLKDHGLLPGLEGRICRSCGGSQVKSVEASWPNEWKAGGSRPAFRAESSYSSDLVLAMVRPTVEEAQTASKRGYGPLGVDYQRAILMASTACERCMNVLAFRCGLEDGYEEGSTAWQRANTRCAMCDD